MPIDKTANHEKIVAAAKKEFLTYGFTDASMRHIAEEAGMSASGLYKHFPSKEEMFSALVEPAYQGLLALFRQEADDQGQMIGTGDLSRWETGRDAKLAITYIYDHLDAFRLIICKSQGTKYESFLHDLTQAAQERTLQYLPILREKGLAVREISPRELHLLYSAYVTALFEPVIHRYSLDESMRCLETIEAFFLPGWKTMFGF